MNSYRFIDQDKQETRLADLLQKLHDIKGLERIKFVTSYPKDMTYDLLTTIRDLEKCSTYLHVPLQSGSDAVLKRMKRGYTVGQYRDMMARINETLGDKAAVSSDFIVGFCGETDAEFQETVDLVQECRFKNSFIFKYSERPGTKAHDQLPDDVPFDVKRRRNNELLQLQNRISEEDNQKFLGRTVDVLIEGPSKRHDAAVNEVPSAAAEEDLNRVVVGDPSAASGKSDLVQLAKSEPATEQIHEQQFAGKPLQLTGRTLCDRIVVFDGSPRLIGQTLPIGIYEVSGLTLMGTAVSEAKSDLVSLL